MLKVLLARAQQKYRTAAYPAIEPEMPDRFRGAPVLDPAKCVDGCRECVEVCPTDAVTATAGGGLALDMGRCWFCTECVSACPEGAVAFSRDYRLAARTRAELVVTGSFEARARQSPVPAPKRTCGLRRVKSAERGIADV